MKPIIFPLLACTARMRRGISAIFVVCLFILISICGLHAQQITGTIVGTVHDEQGAVISKATVKATDVDTGIAHSTASDDHGDYRIQYLAIGNYVIEVTAQHFKTLVQPNVVLTINQTQRVDATLTVGTQNQTVTVSSAPPLINTSTAEIGRTVEANEITGLPLVNRDVYQQLSLTPGVQTSTGISSNFIFGLPSQQTGINGDFDTYVGSTTYYLDGGLSMGGLRDTGNTMPNPDALQEFRVETSNYSAQFGRSSAGVISVVTRSGSNLFHGSAFEFVRNTALNATPWNSTTNAPYHRNQFGGTVGGPIIHDRTFFFFSYGGLRQTAGSFLNGAIVPTALERTGNFSQSTVKPVDPVTRTVYDYNGVPGWIPPNDLDPTAQKIINQYIPLPNAPNNQWKGFFTSPLTSNEYLGKVDHNISATNHLNVSYFTTQTTYNFPTSSQLIWSNQTDFSRQQNVNVSDVQTLGASLANQVWLSYTRLFGGRLNAPAISLGDLGSSFIIQGQPSLPELDVSGYFSLGESIQGPNSGTNFYSIRDVVSKTIGRHSLNFGGEMSLDKDIQLTDVNNYGIFSFATAAPDSTKNALADFVTGRPAAMTQSSPALGLTNSFSYAAFLQDAYRVNARLTLNLGLRYDIQTPPTDPQNKELTFSPGVQSKVIPQAPLGLLFPGDPGVTRGTVGLRLHHLSPRIGVAWDPYGDGKTSLRAAGGVFYGMIGGNQWNIGSNTAPFAITQTYNSIESLTNPYGNPASFPNGSPFPYTYSPAHPTFIPDASVYGVSLNYQWPYTYQFTTSVQRELPGSASLMIAYVGSFYHDTPFPYDVNYTPYAPGANTSQASLNSRRPYDPGVLGSITMWRSNNTASYNGLQVSVNKRMNRVFTLNGFYVWSSSRVSVSDLAMPQDYVDLREEKGPSNYDRRNMASISGIWNLAYYSGTNRIYRNLLNGWRISPIVTLNSGAPFNVLTGSDNNADAYNTDRPNLVPGTNAFLDPHRSRPAVANKWFNTAAFTPNKPGLGIGPYGADGNTPRDYLRAPGYKDVDLGIFRTFNIWRNVNLQARGEATNVFNLVSLSAPTATLSSGIFGKITSASTMRQIQIGMRLTF